MNRSFGNAVSLCNGPVTFGSTVTEASNFNDVASFKKRAAVALATIVRTVQELVGLIFCRRLPGQVARVNACEMPSAATMCRLMGLRRRRAMLQLAHLSMCCYVLAIENQLAIAIVLATKRPCQAAIAFMIEVVKKPLLGFAILCRMHVAVATKARVVHPAVAMTVASLIRTTFDGARAVRAFNGLGEASASARFDGARVEVADRHDALIPTVTPASILAARQAPDNFQHLYAHHITALPSMAVTMACRCFWIWRTGRCAARAARSSASMNVVRDRRDTGAVGLAKRSTRHKRGGWGGRTGSCCAPFDQNRRPRQRAVQGSIGNAGIAPAFSAIERIRRAPAIRPATIGQRPGAVFANSVQAVDQTVTTALIAILPNPPDQSKRNTLLAVGAETNFGICMVKFDLVHHALSSTVASVSGDTPLISATKLIRASLLSWNRFLFMARNPWLSAWNTVTMGRSGSMLMIAYSST